MLARAGFSFYLDIITVYATKCTHPPDPVLFTHATSSYTFKILAADNFRLFDGRRHTELESGHTIAPAPV